MKRSMKLSAIQLRNLLTVVIGFTPGVYIYMKMINLDVNDSLEPICRHVNLSDIFLIGYSLGNMTWMAISSWLTHDNNLRENSTEDVR